MFHRFNNKIIQNSQGLDGVIAIRNLPDTEVIHRLKIAAGWTVKDANLHQDLLIALVCDPFPQCNVTLEIRSLDALDCVLHTIDNIRHNLTEFHLSAGGLITAGHENFVK